MNSCRTLLAIMLALLMSPSCGFAAQPAVPMLRGELKESQESIRAAQNHALGFATHKDAQSGDSKVTTVYLGTPAWYQGLQRDDKIVSESIKERPDGLDGVVTFLRNGQRFSVSLSSYGNYRQFLGTGAAAASLVEKPDAVAEHGQEQKEDAPAKANIVTIENGGRQPPAPLEDLKVQPERDASFSLATEKSEEQQEAKRVLQGRDLAVLIDRSGSMSTTDCPQATSRWDWCKAQLTQMQANVRTLFPTGFTVVLFNNHQKVFHNADFDEVAKAFLDNKPDGGTDTAAAVACELKDHSQTPPESSRVKPLVIVVITDGAPNDETALRKTLITAANESFAASDVSVVFLQVGEDDQAEVFLQDLDHNLGKEGAKFRIVHTVTFDVLRQRGLLPALAEALEPRDNF